MTNRIPKNEHKIVVTSDGCIADGSMIKIKELAKTKKVLKVVSACGELKQKWMVKLAVYQPDGTLADKWADIVTGTLYDAETGRTGSRQLYLAGVEES